MYSFLVGGSNTDIDYSKRPKCDNNKLRLLFLIRSVCVCVDFVGKRLIVMSGKGQRTHFNFVDERERKTIKL